MGINEQPAFEIHVAGRAMLIYASGRIEDVAINNRLDRRASVIVNRIPGMIAQAVAAVATKAA